MYSSLKDVIIAHPVPDVCLTWIITALGQITVLDFGIESISYYCLFIRFMDGGWKWNEVINLLTLLVLITLDCCVAVLITIFLKFHIKLLSENKTTLENLEAKGTPFVSRFDKGFYRNIEQVFGNNRFLWPFPLYLESGKPIGDGVYWEIEKLINEQQPKSDKFVHDKSDNDGDETDGSSQKGQTFNGNQNTLQIKYPQQQMNKSDRAKFEGQIQANNSQPVIIMKDPSNILEIHNPPQNVTSQLKAVISVSNQRLQRKQHTSGNHIMQKK
ncbi:UNKNOWN [Stylonychia lemnae]|uniref:Uncharacterized protein n=1 Tax=Stylonychia lemnae TaxID=5949 RepID=A0A078A652_STYLE|nr:UNKNOWN [Stylonychia lemnae]|eukprot:CDW77040.1 UNKNOWN [Stylonychia lemnae]